ncbi:MAG: hypothetical protein RL272_676 [Candidatus Parcubacteria bacterium]
MTRHDGTETKGTPEELEELKDEFAAAMRDLRRRQRSAVEKALKAVDMKKSEKIRKRPDEISK